MDSNTFFRSSIYTLLIAFILVTTWIVVGNFSFLTSKKTFPASLIGGDISVSASVPAAIIDLPIKNWSVPNPEMGAEAVLCIERTSEGKGKVLFNQNNKRQLPIASLTKLMTALVIIENYELDKVIIVSKEAVDQVGEQGMLVAGEPLSMNDLLYIMLIESSNDAAYSLAEVVGVDNFVNLMNQTAKRIGLNDTSFADPSGLSAKNISTADDVVKLTSYIIDNKPVVFEILLTKSIKLYTFQGKLHHELINTNELLSTVPDIVGGKTGKTSEAKGCLMLAVNNIKDNNILIYVLLGSNDRFGEMTKLMNWVNTAYTW